MSLTPRAAIAAFLALSLATIGYVLFSQYVQHYHPCELCLRERLPWYVVIGLGVVGLIRPSFWLLGLIGLALLVGAGFGLHHVGVEQLWWPGPAACTGTSGADTIDELRAILKSEPVVRCDEITWTLFGLSMATYNFIVSLAGAILALAALLRLRGAPNV
jgi:disulfide bond formation protein DsbB